MCPGRSLALSVILCKNGSLPKSFFFLYIPSCFFYSFIKLQVLNGANQISFSYQPRRLSTSHSKYYQIMFHFKCKYQILMYITPYFMILSDFPTQSVKSESRIKNKRQILPFDRAVVPLSVFRLLQVYRLIL